MLGGGKAVGRKGFIVPENDGKPEHEMFGDIAASYGFVRHVKGLVMENVCVTADYRMDVGTL